MKKRLLTTAILAFAGLQQPALAWGDENHGNHTHSEKQVTVATKPEAALKALRSGIAMMADTVSEKNRKEMLADGPIMEKWHEEAGIIQDAATALKQHATTLPDGKKQRLEGALKQLSKLLDDFHIATHHKDAAKAQAEAAKAEAVLKLIEANIQ